MGVFPHGPLRPPPYLEVLIMTGILFVAPSSQFLRNSASNNVWRRQSLEESQTKVSLFPPTLPPYGARRAVESHTQLSLNPPILQRSGGRALLDSYTEVSLFPPSIAPRGGDGARQGGGPVFCHGHCFREPGPPGTPQFPSPPSCVDPNYPAVLAKKTDCHPDTGQTLTCVTFQIWNHGTRQSTKNKVKMEAERKQMMGLDAKGCMIGYGAEYDPYAYPPAPATRNPAVKVDREECALEHLNMKLEKGCVKGLYEGEYVLAFLNCARGEFLPDRGSDYFSSRRTFNYLKDFSDDVTPKRKQPEGLYWGEYGRVQYFNVVICSCKGGLCNEGNSIKNVKQL